MSPHSKYPLSITKTTVSPLLYLSGVGLGVVVGVNDGVGTTAVAVTSKVKSSHKSNVGVIDGVTLLDAPGV